MAPKIDPYDTPRAKIFDAFLCLLILTLLIFVAMTAHKHSAAPATSATIHSADSQQLADRGR